MNIKTISSFLFISTLLTICTGCDGCGGFAECIGSGEHAFEQKVVFEPGLSQYHIGDTIQISTKFSCLDMLNSITGLREDYCGLNTIEASLQILELDYHFPADSINYFYVFDNFDYQELEGSLKPVNATTRSIFFQTKDSEYSFKFEIIPKIIGRYGVFISDSGPVKLPGSDRCDTGGFSITNGNNNNNIELLEAYSGQGKVSEYERTHIYCFEVIE